MATVTKRRWRTASGEKREGWRLAYTDNEGQRRFEQFTTKKAADDRRVQVENELSRGLHVADAATVTVTEACDNWIKKGEIDDLEWGTLKQRKELVRNHIVPLLGKEKLSRLTVPKVEAFRDTLVETRSRIMAAKIVRALSSVLIEASRQGLVGQNVAANVTVKKKGRDEAPIKIPETEQMKAILAAAQSLGNEIPEAYPFVLLIASAGLRGSEMRGLAWPNIDFRANTVTVTQRADQRGIIGKCKSKAAYRTIPIAPAVVTALKAWKLRCPPSEMDLVFPNENGRPIHVNNLREYRWLPVLKGAGMARTTGERDCKNRKIYDLDWGLHDLRHFCASRWIKQKIDLKRLTTWLGHSSVAITLDIYGHLIKDEDEDARIIAAAQAELMA